MAWMAGASEERRRDGAPVGAAVAADAVEAGASGFHRAFPQRSAKRLHVLQALWLLALLAGLIWASVHYPRPTQTAIHFLGLFLFSAMIFTRFLAAAQITPIPMRLASPASWPTYTVLCPLYREATLVEPLAQALARLDYPREALDMKFLVESDDPDTVEAAHRAAQHYPVEVIVIPAAKPRTKPKALNIGLTRARGQFITVYDAEDRPHPQQLRAALAAFESGSPALACVQAPLAIDNADASWIARQFAAEYAIQFQEILPLLARLGVALPLGGSSNHFRTDTLRSVGGWDPYNVTEDADVGYRLARERMQIGVIAPPTYEEAPVRFGAWLNQRTRWIKGHLQTWLVLMRNPFRTAHEMGLRNFLAMQLILGGGLLAAFAHAPFACVVAISLLSPYDLLGPAGLLLASTGFCVAALAALTASALSGNFSHLRAALTMPFYWPLSSLAAVRAVFELLARPHHWSKTAHGVSARRDYLSPSSA
ncbi:MAG: glycosyltransferase [Hyphomonadaceae bacterium]|nr:glycosyltransferase [Hyphomonadaceae bacterium]